MAKKFRKPKKKKNEQHPTLFVFEGTIRYYEEGSMLELHTQLTPEEWKMIIEETIAYKIFLECLKKVAFPILGEPWDKEDDWFRIQLDVAVSRMRNIDPLLVAKFNVEEIETAYSDKMRKNAEEVQNLVEEMREQKRAALKEQHFGGEDIEVSEL